MNIRRFATISTLATVLAVSTSACSFDVSLGKKSASPTASSEPTSEATASSDADSESTASASNGSNDSGVNGSGHVAGGTSEARPQNIPVPAGTGLKKLELLHIYGGPTSTDSYGQSVAIFRATTDRPMMITTKITLMDKDGKKLRDQEGINTFYRSGTQTFIAHNLVELEDWDKPAKYRVEVVDTTDGGPNFSELSAPTVKQGELAPELTGDFAYSGEYASGSEISGACVLSNGTIEYGSDSLDEGDTSGTYKIPMYDTPKGTDLSTARCYVSV